MVASQGIQSFSVHEAFQVEQKRILSNRFPILSMYICLLSTMNFLMFCKICVLAKHFSTFITFIRFFTGMNFLVICEVCILTEGFSTYIYRVSLQCELSDVEYALNSH